MTKPRRSPRSPSRNATPIDAYLAGVGDDRRRTALERLRETIRAAVPEAVECISYGMPAFRLDGRVVAGFQATSRGCSYYPFSGATLDALGDALDGFSRTKSALHFDADRPLAEALVRKLVRARLAEVGAATGRRSPRTEGRG
jgi:uncharacterized protein YdhG (YjbR/CyaY superfamily)